VEYYPKSKDFATT